MKAWSFKTTRGNSFAHRLVLSLAILAAASWTGAGPAQADVDEAAEATEIAAHAVPIAPPSGVLRVGERLKFHGRWLGIPVGHGWIEVKSLVEFQDRPAYYIEAEGRTNSVLSTFYPVHDTIRSYLDAETLQPLQFEKHQREGNYRADETVTFDYDRLLATYHSELNGSTKEVPIPADVQDIVSAFYWLRVKYTDPSQPITLPMYSDEKIYHTTFEPVRPLMLEMRRRGVIPSLLIEPHAAFKGIFIKRGRMHVYVSADERRLPLLFKLFTPWGLITGIIDRSCLSSSSHG
ncbi:MAG: DUF3108 domain-containing protein [Candidatus Omnitrophica bacterium]|nr:DUF3108 domain-containing protein [Candidatus Omnitrophota bacterium]